MKQDRDDYRYHRDFTPMTNKEYRQWLDEGTGYKPVQVPKEAFEALDNAKVTARKWIVLALLVAALAAWIWVRP